MLPNYTVLDANLEFLPEDAIRSLQSERLGLQVRQCYRSSSFWRRKFDDIYLTPEDIGGLSDLHKIPFCTKAELLEDQEKYPPFGNYLSVHPSRLAKYFTTSGTTGRPLTRVYSDREMEPNEADEEWTPADKSAL